MTDEYLDGIMNRGQLKTNAEKGPDPIVLHTHQEILDLFAQNTGNYDPEPDEVDRITDGLTLILSTLVQEATKATAARCVEICNQIDDDMPGCATAKRCAIDIKKEHGLE